jgi:N-acetylglucosamine kinase-like BadF-type ATPase
VRIVAGCDGGGTKCAVRVAVLENDTTVCEAVGNAGPANVATNSELAIENIRLATVRALTATGLDLDSKWTIEHMVVALAGASKCVSSKALESRMLRELPIRRVSIIPDASILFSAAELTGPAVATIIGTGSIAWARDNNAVITRAGGLGPIAGDEGSGYWIGSQAIATKILDLDNATEDYEAIALLAPQVFSAAARDPSARKIIQQSAAHIADILVDATELIETSAECRLSWVSAGGVAMHQPAWLETIHHICDQRGLFLSQPIPIAEPVLGALRMAMKSLR